jgi:GTP cyclohydrolase I
MGEIEMAKPRIPKEVREFYVEPDRGMIDLDEVTEYEERGKRSAHLGKMPSQIRDFLSMIGEDPDREGLVETPYRMIRAGAEIFRGYRMDPAEVFTQFDSDGYQQIVLLKDVEFFSMCEHHVLPFFGRAHIAYIPKDKVIGISKLARLLDIYSRRLQIQERLGDQITNAIMTHLDAQGAACILEANHLCMRMRGVEKQNSLMITSSLRGCFMEEVSARNELMLMIKG